MKIAVALPAGTTISGEPMLRLRFIFVLLAIQVVFTLAAAPL
jgi:hypothetical protein